MPLPTSDVITQRSAARAGLGVAMLPRFFGDREDGLVEVEPDADMPHRSAWLMIHPDVRRSAAVRVVADHLATIFADDYVFDTLRRTD